MVARTSKSIFLYDEVRAAILDGRYVPGHRIDPLALATHFKASPTPVRFALYRLVGEGLVVDLARDGFHVPLFTEVALRSLYDVMQRLLVIACESPGVRASHKDVVPEGVDCHADVVARTHVLFDTIALTTGEPALYDIVRNTNARLAPIRRVKHRLVPNTAAELATLAKHWRRRDVKALRAALILYHEHRKRLVPHIVAAQGQWPLPTGAEPGDPLGGACAIRTGT